MQGSERIPADSPEAASSNESSTRRAPSRPLRENVHTNVLGRDAGDATREVGFGTSENSSAASGNPSAASMERNEHKGGGWFGIFGGSNNNSNEKTNPNNPTTNYHPNRRRRNNNARYDGLQQSLEEGNYDPPPLEGLDSSSRTDSLATPTEATAATREDQVRQECSSTFFRGMEETAPSSPYHRTRSSRRGGRTVAKSNRMLHRMSLRARLSGGLSGEVDGALFMSRYERLNQVLDPTHKKKPKARHLRGQQYTGTDNSSSHQNNNNSSSSSNHHDLFLDENDGSQPSSYREHIPSPTNNLVMGATSLANPHGVRSSMFFEQDGRVLMRLPRDQVRLVMDYNLEPGIISVEQWRSQEDAQLASEKLAAQNALTKQSVKNQRAKERRHRRRERERRRRRRRKQQTQQRQQKAQDGARDETQALETVPLAENKESDVEGNSKKQHDDDYDDDSYSSYSADTYSDSDDEEGFRDQDLLPELKYVITIPDDLYRRMVAEMSSKIFPPYWGFFKCCHQESERADIRLALVILAVVMSVLFIGSLEWRTT